MRPSFSIFSIALLHLVLLWRPQASLAESARALVADGNSAYEKGNYDQALAAYDKASVEKPESPRIYFNKGAVYYRKGDYAKAGELFERAALKTRDLRLEARCSYNLGNCSFHEGERQKDSDLKKALEAYQTSVRHYQKALELDPGLRDAAHNIEVARLIMKDILDKLKEQQQEAQKQQQAQKEIVEKLKQLIERQQQALDRNKKLSQERAQQGQSEEHDERIRELAEEQEAIREETAALSEKLAERQRPRAQPQAAPLDKAREHLDRSATEQAVARERLRKEQLDGARPAQEHALEELRKALEALSGEQSPRQPQQGQRPPEQQPDEKNKQETTKQDKTAQEILDEEKQNRRRRQLGRPGGYRPVEKDW